MTKHQPLRSTPLHTVSQLLTAATSSLSTHNQLYYRITNSNHSVSSTNTTQCPLYFTLYTVCLYSERLLNCTVCSVSSISSSNTGSKQCICVSELAKFEGNMKNTVWYGVTSLLCDTVLLVAVFAELFLNINPPLHVHSL